jgi:hypothetical protein
VPCSSKSPVSFLTPHPIAWVTSAKKITSALQFVISSQDVTADVGIFCHMQAHQLQIKLRKSVDSEQ